LLNISEEGYADHQPFFSQRCSYK